METSYTTLPLTGTINRNNVTHKHLPGWNKEVSDLQQKSRYAYRVWLANGKPNQGPIHSEKLRSQSVFRQAVRKIKRNSKKYQAEALLEAALQGDLNLMKEMKRIKSGKGNVKVKCEIRKRIAETNCHKTYNKANKCLEIFIVLKFTPNI